MHLWCFLTFNCGRLKWMKTSFSWELFAAKKQTKCLNFFFSFSVALLLLGRYLQSGWIRTWSGSSHATALVALEYLLLLPYFLHRPRSCDGRIFLGDGFYCTKNMYMQYIDFFFSVVWGYKCAISIFYLSHVKDADMIMYLFCCGNNHLYSEVNKCFFLIISSHLKWETSFTILFLFVWCACLPNLLKGGVWWNTVPEEEQPIWGERAHHRYI